MTGASAPVMSPPVLPVPEARGVVDEQQVVVEEKGKTKKTLVKCVLCPKCLRRMKKAKKLGGEGHEKSKKNKNNLRIFMLVIIML